MIIKEVIPKIILNSRKEKTIQITIITNKGKFSASAPSGKSKGKYETPDYNPRGILFSFHLLKEFIPEIINKPFSFNKFEDLKFIEDKLIKFEKEMGILGANFTYALETAILRAAAKENDQELWSFILEDKKIKIPMPVGNCLGGGLHSHIFPRPDFQEFLLIPNEKTFSHAFTKMFRAYETAKKSIKALEKKWRVQINDEGAWQTSLSNELCLDILKTIADKYDLKIGLDIAASSFFNKKSKYFEYKNKSISRDLETQLEYLRILISKFSIFYLEDPLDEDNFFGFSRIVSIKEKNLLVVGDDLTVTNLDRLKKAVLGKSINSIIIKPNQSGYLLKVKEIVEFCKKNNIKMIFSHRSGETMDESLADYAIGFQADFIKTGIYGPTRLIKLKRIMEIEKSLGLS